MIVFGVFCYAVGPLMSSRAEDSVKEKQMKHVLLDAANSKWCNFCTMHFAVSTFKIRWRQNTRSEHVGAKTEDT